MMLLMALAPVFAAALWAGWTSWSVAPGLVSLLGLWLGQPRWGLAAGLVGAALAVGRHGAPVFMTLVAVWLAWLPPKPGYHGAAAALLGLAGGLQVSVRGPLWGAGMLLFVWGWVRWKRET